MLEGSLSTVTNAEDWDFEITVIDADTKEPIDISGATEILIEVRKFKGGSSLLTATIGDGVTISATTGLFSLHFGSDATSALCAETYRIGGVMTLNGARKQLLVGTIPVLDGVVTS